MRAEYDFSKGKRGAALPQKGKTRISIFIDNAVLDAFRARAQKEGTGYQTMMNEALRQYVSNAEPPLTEAILRHVLRQEISEYLHGPTATGSMCWSHWSKPGRRNVFRWIGQSADSQERDLGPVHTTAAHRR